MPESIAPEDVPEALTKLSAAGASAPRAGRDPVNQPMINNWVEALGDTNPIYVDDEAARAAGHPGIVAPPAMAQVWTMNGLHGTRTADDPLGLAAQLLDDAGYTSVVGTNCEQTYHRYLRPGEEVTVSSRLSEFKGPKRTGLGDGWFLTFTTSWHVGDELVTEMLFRILKFAPAAAVNAASDAVATAADSVAPSGVDTDAGANGIDLAPAGRVGPVISRDTEFFWTGTELGELRIQRLPDGTLRHPPVPALWQDKAEPTDYVVAAGTGTVFSFVVHHAPKVPGRELPFVVALVELDEGVRMLGELRGIDPAEVEIGVPVRADFEKLADGTVLPFWQAQR
ncbi:bifunctional MaoC family dehydratase N-terminal/OB-fold nucleic acid binding domain-containing protein [Nocardia mangyaensis]|uniref:bifunctional MaoC family dehydratase N-terminal/OB-fold nucleic acid binding domain-containing protein n=1 Tax=Nocardia mangyaensis TaxID=2213200 RepID=UPI00267503EC|nr:OB-fold domain-containing protein [Nocardia mangyaensis]MDO3651144.1 OB-fold domain-containing protein [Nocardia mangyaensis]